MTLEEKMRRKNPDDQIEIGQIADRITSGDAGSLLKMVCEGIREEYLRKADEDPRISSERALGIIIGVNQLQERLDQCVDIKNQLLAEKLEEAKVKSGDGRKLSQATLKLQN